MKWLLGARAPGLRKPNTTPAPADRVLGTAELDKVSAAGSKPGGCPDDPWPVPRPVTK